MASQAVEARAPAEAVFFVHLVAREGTEAEPWARVCKLGIAHHVVSRGVFARLHGLRYQVGAGVLATVAVRPPDLDHLLTWVDDSFCALLAEDVEDPGNVGALVRKADAWAARLVTVSADSADPFSRASVRASTGSIFRVPVLRAENLQGTTLALKSRRVSVIGAAAPASDKSWDACLSRPCALVVGNETAQLPEGIRLACDLMVSIPMCGGAHSLNVAVANGILLYEIVRQDTYVSLSG